MGQKSEIEMETLGPLKGYIGIKGCYHKNGESHGKDNGTRNGSYYLGLRLCGLGLRDRIMENKLTIKWKLGG